MSNKLTLSLACILGLSSMAQAAESGQTIDATVCASAPYPALAAGTTIFNDKVEFICGNSQKGNIPALAKMGWHIVSVQQHQQDPMKAEPTAVTILILEKSVK